MITIVTRRMTVEMFSRSVGLALQDAHSHDSKVSRKCKVGKQLNPVSHVTVIISTSYDTQSNSRTRS